MHTDGKDKKELVNPRGAIGDAMVRPALPKDFKLFDRPRSRAFTTMGNDWC